jgi:hypothetical protein
MNDMIVSLQFLLSCLICVGLLYLGWEGWKRFFRAAPRAQMTFPPKPKQQTKKTTKWVKITCSSKIIRALEALLKAQGKILDGLVSLLMEERGHAMARTMLQKENLKKEAEKK